MSLEQPHPEPAAAEAPMNDYPSWSPRFWHGMRSGCWWRMLARNRFRIAPRRLHIAVGVSFFTPINDLLAILQRIRYGRRIAQANPQRPPIFILGHWRSGTTLLHELMVVDPRFASPSTYQCFAPWHFLVSEWLMVRLGGFLLPKKRPMDQMAAGWNLPQEDEFALMNLGVPTPYLRIAFPQTEPRRLEYLDMQDLSQHERAFWRDRFLWFIRALTVRHEGKQLVLKSPPHTGRMAELASLFPGAKFIHLTRDPRKLFASTMRLWRSLDDVQALQDQPPEDEMRDYVWECLSRMYSAFEAAREQVPPDQLIDVRYEELVADPLGTLRTLYEQLELGEFSEVEAALGERLTSHRDYRVNRHVVDLGTEREILSRWSAYAQRYGYANDQVGSGARPSSLS